MEELLSSFKVKVCFGNFNLSQNCDASTVEAYNGLEIEPWPTAFYLDILLLKSGEASVSPVSPGHRSGLPG